MNLNNYKLLYKEENGLDIYAIKTDEGKLVLYWKNKNSSNINNIIVILNNSDNIRISNNQMCISLDGINNINDIKIMLSIFTKEVQKIGIDVRKVRFTFIIDNNKQKEEMSALANELGLNASYQKSNNYQEEQKKEEIIEQHQQSSNAYGTTDTIKKYNGNKEESFVISDGKVYRDNDTLSIAEKKQELLAQLLNNPDIAPTIKAMSPEVLDEYLTSRVTSNLKSHYLEQSTNTPTNTNDAVSNLTSKKSHQEDGYSNEELGIVQNNVSNNNKYSVVEENTNGEVQIVNPTVTNANISSQSGVNNITSNSYNYTTQDNSINNNQENTNLSEEQIQSRETVNIFYLENDGKTIVDSNDNVIGSIGVDGYLNFEDKLYQNGQLIGKIGDKSEKRIQTQGKARVYKPEHNHYNNTPKKEAAFISLPVIIFIISLVLLIGSGIILFLMK